MQQSVLWSIGRWSLIVLLGTAVLGASSLFLTRSMPTVIAATVAPAHARTVPSYIARLEPIRAGSINAIAPLPQRQPQLMTVATVEPRASPETIVPPDRFVVRTSANVRSAPSKHSERIGTLIERTAVTVVDRDGNWALVVAESGFRGWVFSKFLTQGSEAVASAD